MPAALQEQITPSECGMGIYRLHGFFGLFPSVLPFLFIIFCPFPFPVLFLGFVCALFVLMFFFVCPCFLVCSFSCSLIVCLLLFCFIVFCPFPFIFSFLFAVCYSFPSPLLSSLFSFRSFPIFLFPFVSCYFSFVFLPSFLFLDVFGIFSLVYNFGETYYIILCACSFTSLHPLLTHVFFLLHDLRRGQTHG